MGRFDHLELGDWLSQQPEDAPAAGIIDQNYYLEKANEAFADENYERAMAYYSRSLQYDISCEDAWVGQLRCLIELNELQEAVIWANRALERFPNGSAILAARAVSESRMGKTAKALSLSDGAFSAQGSSAYLWVARGEVLIPINPTNAKACFGKAIELATSDWAVRAWIARAYIAKKCYHQALGYLIEAVRLDPDRFTCWYWIGRCNETLGNIDDSKQAYQRTLAIEPRFTRARDAISRLRNRGPLSRIGSSIRKVFSGRKSDGV